MLSVLRAVGESVSIGEWVVTVTEVGPSGARLLVDAPLSVPVRRGVVRPNQPLTFTVFGHELRGVPSRRGWHWSCTSWPALAAEHDGCESPEPIVVEFIRRALEGTDAEVAAGVPAGAERRTVGADAPLGGG